MFGRWNTPLAFGVFTLGWILSGRRVRKIMLAIIGCMLVFIFGTQTDPSGWTLTIWSWLAIGGAIVACCYWPRARRLDFEERTAARVEGDIEEAQYEILVAQEAAARLSGPRRTVVEAAVIEEPPAAPESTVEVVEDHQDPVGHSYETAGGLLVRDRRAVDPDTI